MTETKKDRRGRNWRSFEEARAYARSLGFKNMLEWIEWAKSGARPEDIPSSPRKVYKVAEDTSLRHGAGQLVPEGCSANAASAQGWISLGDWLGTDHIAYKKMVYRPFAEAREFVRGLGLKNFYEWKEWTKSGDKPEDIPAGAHRTYKDKGWAGWGDWLGMGRASRTKKGGLP